MILINSHNYSYVLSPTCKGLSVQTKEGSISPPEVLRKGRPRHATTFLQPFTTAVLQLDINRVPVVDLAARDNGTIMARSTMNHTNRHA